MRYGIDVAIIGDLADPVRVVELARAAEAHGWEALFVWDHLAFTWGPGSADPWVVLAAAAQATSRIKLGTAVTAPARRRPVVLAQQVATLDRLSGGRAVLGAGLGGVRAEFTAFGESGEPGERATKLEESLEVITALWSGEKVQHRGAHYTVDGVSLAPLPLQRPRVPIWIGGESPPALRRAARWDGWVFAGDDERARMTKSPDEVAGTIASLSRPEPFDVAMTGVSEPGEAKTHQAYAEAGVTWWLEHLHGNRGGFDDLMARVTAGP